MADVLQMALGLEGLVLLRNWLTGDEREIDRRIAEIRSLLDGGAASATTFAAPERSVAEGYSSWAATYDAPGNPFINLEQPVVHELLAGLPLGRVLDAAAGTGRHTAYLRSLGHAVVSVDATTSMLEQLRRRTPDAEIRPGELAALPLETASVDAAVCSLALTHCPDLGPPIAELARVVRPGGQLILSDIHPFAVFLGAQAAYRGAEGARGFVRNHIHLPGAYLATFRAAGVEVLACYEPPLRAEHASLLANATLRSFPQAREGIEGAIDGLPAILVWHLARP